MWQHYSHWSRGARAVATYLGQRQSAQQTKAIRIAHKELAQATGLSIPTIKRALRTLEAAQVLHVSRQLGGDGRHLMNRYGLKRVSPSFHRKLALQQDVVPVLYAYLQARQTLLPSEPIALSAQHIANILHLDVPSVRRALAILIETHRIGRDEHTRLSRYMVWDCYQGPA